MQPLDHIHIPEFREYITTPNNPTCPVIDSTRLMVEILGGLHSAAGEFGESTFSTKMLIDGNYALVIHYKREKDDKYRPACSLRFDVNENGIHIRQLQGSNDKSIAFRFHSSFHTNAYLLKLLEESFMKKGIRVDADIFPAGIENAAYASQASSRYTVLRTAIIGLNTKYGL